MRTGDKVKITDSESGVCFGRVISHGPRSFVVDWGDGTCSYGNDDERVTLAHGLPDCYGLPADQHSCGGMCMVPRC